MKRQIKIYEVLDPSGGTISFEPTIARAMHTIRQQVVGCKWQLIVVPLSPLELCKFLTEKAGGAG